MKCQFSVGDRVVFIRDRDPDGGVVFGMTGTVCEVDDYFDDHIGVKWDEKEDGHDCNGTCEYGFGWSVPTDMVDFLSDSPAISTEDAQSLLQMVIGR